MDRSLERVPGRTKLATFRAVNAAPWEPPRGMFRVQCEECRFWYADRNRYGVQCPDCQVRFRRLVRGRPLRIVKKPQSVEA